jgi:outer membrane protein assembly factor BamB
MEKDSIKRVSDIKTFYKFSIKEKICTNQYKELMHYWITGITYGNNKIYLADLMNSRIYTLIDNQIGLLKIDSMPFNPASVLLSNNLLYMPDFQNKDIKILNIDSNSIKTISLKSLDIDRILITRSKNNIFLLTTKNEYDSSQSLNLYSLKNERIIFKHGIKLSNSTSLLVIKLFINDGQFYIGTRNGDIINISNPHEYFVEYSISDQGIGSINDLCKIKNDWFFLDHDNNEIIKIADDRRKIFKWKNTLNGWLLKFEYIKERLVVTTGDFNNEIKIFVFDI